MVRGEPSPPPGGEPSLAPGGEREREPGTEQEEDEQQEAEQEAWEDEWEEPGLPALPEEEALDLGDASPAGVFLAGQLSPETQRAYRGDLAQWAAWCARRGKTVLGGAVTRSDVVAYRNDLLGEGYAVTTIARRLSVVRQLYDYAVAEGVLRTNPAAHVKSYRVPQVSARSALDNQEVRALLAAPDRRSVKGKRDYALLMLAVYLGLRRSEIVSVRGCQFGSERGHHTLRVTGKGRVVAVLAVPPPVIEALRVYLDAAGRLAVLDERLDEELFRPLRNRRTGTLDKALDADSLLRLVKDYARKAGLPESAAVGVHTLRHTAASAALDNGASIRSVQKMLRHADPKTTMRYDTRRTDLDQSATYRIHYDS